MHEWAQYAWDLYVFPNCELGSVTWIGCCSRRLRSLGSKFRFGHPMVLLYLYSLFLTTAYIKSHHVGALGFPLVKLEERYWECVGLGFINAGKSGDFGGLAAAEADCQARHGLRCGLF
ncbi:hypothetical protein NDU88_001241 [Pleurodeles waltl]|uniref:Uncharacterized protein n=1 Tax=Pleurodeles waltl TaxID=8319 RepID=A0AAV7NAH3_PLEWA|nr:hypothetical protein NDU88_001241 [Pleurodeles waltl]